MDHPMEVPRFMKRCARCTSTAPLVGKQVQVSRDVAGHLFIAFVPGQSCTACGESYFDARTVELFELHVARKLADAGIAQGDAFRFMRKAIRMQANALAELLDVAPETISRWETDKRVASRGASVVLTALVRDACEGRTTTLDCLRRLQRPHKLEKTVRIDLAAKLARS